MQYQDKVETFHDICEKSLEEGDGIDDPVLYLTPYIIDLCIINMVVWSFISVV